MSGRQKIVGEVAEATGKAAKHVLEGAGDDALEAAAKAAAEAKRLKTAAEIAMDGGVTKKVTEPSVDAVVGAAPNTSRSAAKVVDDVAEQLPENFSKSLSKIDESTRAAKDLMRELAGKNKKGLFDNGNIRELTKHQRQINDELKKLNKAANDPSLTDAQRTAAKEALERATKEADDLSRSINSAKDALNSAPRTIAASTVETVKNAIVYPVEVVSAVTVVGGVGWAGFKFYESIKTGADAKKAAESLEYSVKREGDNAIVTATEPEIGKTVVRTYPNDANISDEELKKKATEQNAEDIKKSKENEKGKGILSEIMSFFKTSGWLGVGAAAIATMIGLSFTPAAGFSTIAGLAVAAMGAIAILKKDNPHGDLLADNNNAPNNIVANKSLTKQPEVLLENPLVPQQQELIAAVSSVPPLPDVTNKPIAPEISAGNSAEIKRRV